MSWARFDDRAPHHRKVKRLSDAAFRLWFTSICHCAEYLTDGRIDAADVPELPKVPSGKKLEEAIRELVSAGCWDVVEGGWEVHDYLDWNPTGDEARAKREARAEAGRKGGQNSGKARSKKEAIASHEVKQTTESGEPKPNPVPVPVPVPVPGAAATREDLFSLDKALRVPVQDRARLAVEFCAQDSTLATWCHPEKWPEVIDLAVRFAAALGGVPPRLGKYNTDKGAQALVALLATFSAEELDRAIAKAPEDKFVRGRGFSVLSVEVVRQLLQGGRAEAPARSGTRQMSLVQPNHGANPFSLVPQE